MTESKKHLIVYLLLTFAMSWIYAFGVIWRAGAESPYFTMLVAVIMFFPAIGMLLTRLITKEGFHGLMLKPRFKGNVGMYLLAYFGPGLLVLLGAAVYFVLFPGKLDWNAPYLRAVIEASGAELPMPMPVLLAVQVAQGLLLAGLLNLIPALGEEWGWRGYMMPKLRQTMGPGPAILVGGVIWGVWHAPITALGHNYGLGYPGWPWAGIAAMCVFCTVMGTLLTWLTVKTESIIPAALAHGALNGIGAIGMYVSADGGNPFVGPAPMGIIGGAPMLLLAIPAGLWLVRHWRAEKPETETE